MLFIVLNNSWDVLISMLLVYEWVKKTKTFNKTKKKKHF